MLSVDGLTTNYGSIAAVRDVSIHVDAGEIVGLIGPNGAGKSTLLNTTVGLLRPTTGRVIVEGRDVTGSSPDTMLRLGVALVPERRRLFADLTVQENLLVAGITVSAGERQRRLEEVVELFPLLGRRRDFPAGYLSGGEAQQLAIGRALMSGARLLLMDEPTLGLAPALVDLVFELVVDLRSQGRTLLVVEQNAGRLLEVADRAYLMRTGSIVTEGTGHDLRSRHDLFEVYLGVEA
ncbi:MAG TPA: ABC transporter ATP-binding protein [Actinomycetota bacterium]|nr:ABC transporter ATP-binding protein [Actinomycetota bacterium]